MWKASSRSIYDIERPSGANAEYFNICNHPNFAPESTSTGTVNSTDQISAFDKLNGNSAFGTFRAGQAGDPRVAQLAAKLFF
jgi:hypothetical protein